MFASLPDTAGYFGEFGGCFAPELLMQELIELDRCYADCRKDPDFQKELAQLRALHAGRQTPLDLAGKLSDHAGGAQVYLKREDLCSTGSHHINSAIGQALLAKKMGKRILVTDTATGLHGLAVGLAARLMDMQCQIFMGARDCERQQHGVKQMREQGLDLAIVDSGCRSLLEANEAATRDWLGALQDCFYVAHSVVGPHPYPLMVRDFQTVIGEEVRQQVDALAGRLPDHLVASVGGGSNAMGLFYPFLDTDVPLTAVQAAGSDEEPGTAGMARRTGVFQGLKTIIRQDPDGQIRDFESLAVGLQTALLGPELSNLQVSGRVSFESVSDTEALQAYRLLRQLETISPALESAHAIAFAHQLAARLGPGQIVVVNLCGSGEKEDAQLSRMPTS